MTTSPADQSLGAYLTALRVREGLDVAVLARRVSLSSAQVLELESGLGSLFYNRRIRLQAARKIILQLGGDLSHLPVDEPAAGLVLEVPAGAQSLAPQTSVQREAPTPRQAPSAPSRSPAASRSWLMGVTLGSVLLGALILVGTRLSAPGSPVLQVAEVAMPSATPTSAPSTSETSTSAKTSKSESAPAEPAAAQAPDIDIAAVAKPAPSATVSVGEHALAKPLSDACAWASGEVPVYQPAQARKPGDMVYVVSLVAQVLCVADASGKPQVQRLEAGQAQSFYGQPPWQVASSQLQQTQLYFQGWRVRLPAQAQDRIQLVELR